MTDERDERFADDGRPPFGGSWRTIYTVVLVNLAVLVALFYAFTRYFSR